MALDALDSRKHQHGAVENPKRPLDFGRKINVARCVDQVDPNIAPRKGKGGGAHRNAALFLHGQPIRQGGPLVNISQRTGRAAEKKKILGQRGLARVDVRQNTQVPDMAGFVHYETGWTTQTLGSI